MLTRHWGAGEEKMKKRIIITISFCLFISLTHIQCTNKVFTIYPENNDIELKDNIIASIYRGWIYIDIGSEDYGLDCHLTFNFEEKPEEIIIRNIS